MAFNKKFFTTGGIVASSGGPCVTEDLQPLGDSSCVAYYSLDYDASDKSTNYDGTPSNVEFVQNGKINYSAKFNGTTSKIQITSPIGVASGDENDNFSVSMWVKWDSVSSTASGLHGTLVGDYTGSNYGSFHIYVYGLGSGNGLALAFERYFNSTAYYNSSYLTVGTISTLEANTWYYITHTYVGSSKQVKLYSNTTLIATYTLDSSAGGRTTNSYNVIGDYNNSSANGHAGSIDEFRIFNKTLSSDEVTSLAGLAACSQTCTTGTTDFIAPNTAYYKLDGDATDSHGGTYDGTASNITYVSGRFGSAAQFNGSSSVIAIGSPIPNTDTNVAISAWVKLDSGISSHMHITGTGITTGSSEAPFRATLSYVSANTFKIFALRQVAGTYYLAGTGGLNNVTINAGTWYHVVWSYNSTGRELSTFLNGTAIDSGVAMSTSGGSVNDSTSVIGSFRSTDGPFFDGAIDQLRIFNSALSASNVQDLYNTEYQCYITKESSDPFGGSIEKFYYKFDNNSEDSTGSFDATPTNISYSSSVKIIGTHSATFDGTAKITTPYTTNDSAFSISVWVFNDISSFSGENQYAATKGYYTSPSDTNYWSLQNYGTEYTSFIIRSNGTNISATSSVALKVKQWHHIVGTCDSSGNTKIYIDGYQTGSNTGAPSRTMTEAILIGSYFDGSWAAGFYEGNIDNVRYFSSSLTGEQVWKLYAEGNN